jgi:hypothetical protein
MKSKCLSVVLILAFLFNPYQLFACTIFSARDSKGNIWFGNNEDASFSFKNYINVFPKGKGIKFGYYTLSKDKSENGENSQIAGGANEAGLAYDFNATDLYPVKDMYKKKGFPQGDNAILSYILANFERVEQVVAFFDEYWFQFGFRSAQMHLADRFGHFAIISPTGNRVLTNENFQISTNYDICGKADSTSCWRFPIVQNLLKTKEPSLAVFTEVCRKTRQGRHTIYSNINNLTTGEITFYFSGDYSHPFQTNIKTLLKKGKKSYLIADLIPENPICKIYQIHQNRGVESAYEFYEQLNLSAEQQDVILPNLLEYFISETNKYDIYPFLEEFIARKNTDLDIWLVKSAIEMQQGNVEQARQTIAKCVAQYPNQKDLAKDFLNRISSQFESDANATFELEGYQNAKFVIIKSVTSSSNFYPLNNLTFMVRQNESWISKFKLPNGIYNYVFIVDGKEVLDKNTPIKTVNSLTKDEIKCHQLCIGFSNESYPVTVYLTVPNIEDEVYIVGNQESIFKAPLILMRPISAYERQITVNVHYPAVFKFMTGAGKKTGIVEEANDKQTLTIDSKNTASRYKIVEWK